jgi:ATP synthase protein I
VTKKELQHKIKNLDEQIKFVKTKNNIKTESEKKEQSVSGLKYSSLIATDIIAGLAVGAGSGYYLDKFFETKPLFFITFMLLGLLGGFWNIFKHFK